MIDAVIARRADPKDTPRPGERVILPGGREAFLGAVTDDGHARVYPLDDGDSFRVALTDLTRRPPAGQPAEPQIGCAIFHGPRLIGHIASIDGDKITIQPVGEGAPVVHHYAPGELRQAWILSETAG